MTSSSAGRSVWLVVGFTAAALLASGVGAWLVLASLWALAIAALACFALVLVTWRWRDWCGPLLEHAALCGAAVDRLVARRPGPWIALAAAASLCGELLLIRWQASSFQLFSYFKNVTLLACFLGLGIGYARAGARPLLISLGLPAMAAQVVLLRMLASSPVQQSLQSPISELLGLGLIDEGTLGHWLLTYGVLTPRFSRRTCWAPSSAACSNTTCSTWGSGCWGCSPSAYTGSRSSRPCVVADAPRARRDR